MHTDEYEISISRELDICKNKVHVLKKALSLRETKFNMSTEKFIVLYRHGEISVDDIDYISWINDYRALRTWQATLNQYEELLVLMRI
ncbi:MAG: hypothetical protein ACYC69_04080 [Thermodesulfovibrionales bacterium]